MRSFYMLLAISIGLGCAKLAKCEDNEQQPRFRDSPRIAIIDLRHALASSASYQQDMAKLQGELDLISSELPSPEPGCGTQPHFSGDRRFFEELKQIYPATEQQMANLCERSLKRQRLARSKLKALQERKAALLGESLADLQCEVAVFCEEYKIQLVLNRRDPQNSFRLCCRLHQNDSLVIYQDRLDITNDIIERLKALQGEP